MSISEPVARLAYSYEETGQLLGVTGRHVRNLAMQGKIKTVRLGGRVVIRADEIERILTEGAA